MLSAQPVAGGGPPGGHAHPTRGTWALLGLAFLLFAAYGSLVPFRLRPLPFDAALASFREVVAHPLFLRFSRSDVVANVLLFVPVGFCLAGSLRLGRTRWWSGPLATLVVLAVSVPWSLAIEFAQLFTADRITSLGDVAAQTLGAVAGIVGWEAAGEELTMWLRAATAARSRAERIERVLAAYVAVWALMCLAPFDLALDVGTLAGKVRRGRIQLVPFAGPAGALGPWLWDLVSTALAAVPVGAYAVVGRTRDGRRRAWLRAAELSVAGLLVLEVAQVFVASRRADVNDLLAGALGAGAGIWLASRLSGRPAEAFAPGHRGRISMAALAGLAGWCLVLAAYHWMPYDFSADSQMIRRKLARVSLVPFAGYRSGRDLNALNQVLLKVSLSVPLGLLAGFVRRGPAGSPASRLTTLAWLAFAALVLGGIEAGQLFLPTRHPDPTDVLVGVAAAALGLAIARWTDVG